MPVDFEARNIFIFKINIERKEKIEHELILWTERYFVERRKKKNIQKIVAFEHEFKIDGKNLYVTE